MKRTLYTIALLAMFGIQGWEAKAESVKLYAIAFCDTNDESIGKSCELDQATFVGKLGEIEVALGLECDWLNIYTGEQCNKPNLESAISNLKCGPNDIIFFYYTGHGVHAQADPADGWLPQMCLGYKWKDEDKYVPVTYVRDKLVKTGARLCVILSDCCNSEKDWVSVKARSIDDGRASCIDDMDISNLTKLFLDSRGTVIATGCKRGQTSLCTSSRGGFFSLSFWEQIYLIARGEGEGTADWNWICEATKNKTLELSRRCESEQEPAYEVNPDGMANTAPVTPSPSPTPAPTPVTPPQVTPATTPVVIAVGATELGDAFKRIVSPSHSKTERLKMVKGIVQQLFDPKAEVIMVGQNLTTIIGEPRNITNYLEELALSKTVKGINIVRTNKNNAGKFVHITITEIR